MISWSGFRAAIIIRSMEFQLHTTFPANLEKDWNALLTESVTHVPFLRYEYLHNWWQTRGGGEWDHHATLAIITAYEADRLAGIAPLFRSTYNGKNTLLFLGSIEISDYLDFIVRLKDHPAFLKGLLSFLQDEQQLELFNFLNSSPTIKQLQEIANEAGWQFSLETTNHAPQVILPGDWEEYLASLDKKQRHEVRRKIRRLEGAEVPTRWYFVDDAETLSDEIDQFLGLMAQDPEKEAFLTEEMVTTMAGSMEQAFKHGYLQLAFLEIDGQKAAAYYNFDYDNKLWIYNSGLDRQFMSYSPGWVLLGYLLRWANENGRKSFDFMRGDEDYKYKFGAEDRIVQHVTLVKQ